MVKFFRLLSALIFCVGWAAAQQPVLDFGSDPTSVPFRTVDNLVMIDVRVNGSRPVTFIFDTGAASTIIDEGFAAELGLKPSGSTVGSGAVGTATAGVIKGAGLEVGKLKVSDLTIFSLPLSSFTPGFGMKISGILGNDVTAKLIAQVDYAGSTLSLYKHGTYSPSPGTDSVPITMSRNLPFLNTQLRAGRRQLTARMELDTGSTGTVLLNSPFVNKNGLLGGSGPALSAKTGGVGGTGMSTVRRIDNIRVGATVLNAPIAVLYRGVRGDNASSSYDGLIGGAIFRRFKITFDMSGGRIYLEPSSKVNDAFEADMSGLDLVATGVDLNTILVDAVHAGSAAFRSGVRAGDVILSVNGRGDLGLQELRRLFRVDGAEYDVTLRRGKQEVTLHLSLTRVI